MEKPSTRLHDENNGLDYVLVGDYYFPDLILAEDSRLVGRWGRMYKRYLKEHHPARYQALLLSGRLNTYLADIDAQAEEQLKLLTQQMAEREGVNEELKAANQILLGIIWRTAGGRFAASLHRVAPIPAHGVLCVTPERRDGR